ncbi:DUF2778 domain-containing protein [Jiella sp. MQZ9-1]|uniref:DUF2778 domain-containing protein n=1 Tax=Jiella flava TaxID=2816857 RepID=A0A939FXS5_9HYPH|nr:DUF2778 domain-containing protein [Jiella flava]MBO0661487.1 DUF2778 domain-containing protein [Jiella flava]MCD2470129.1 DUF2778 domain-containing protein [Jiella flava]
MFSRLAEDDRVGRVFHSDQNADRAERGARVFVRVASAETSERRAKRPITWLTQTADAGTDRFGFHQISPELAAKVATAASQERPVAPPQNSTAALTQLASYEPQQPTGNAAPTVAAYAAVETPANVPVPSFREAVEASNAVDNQRSTPEDDGVPTLIAIPAERPEHNVDKGVEVASLEPQDMPAPADTDTDAAATLVVPLPEDRPDYQPEVTATPEPKARPEARRQPEKPEQPAPRVAYAPRPTVPTPESPSDSGFGGFFHKLFQGGSTRLPAAGSGIAVYDISAQTVYLPGDRRLEAHSGLGQMQDNPRYVDQKMRGPTPPNIYNLRMREARFHGAEAIRLLPANGRKKFNRDGLLAHPYMYIGGGGRSQSNGCVVFKHYDRFLEAFKRGQINRLIVVKSLTDLPTYMAAL